MSTDWKAKAMDDPWSVVLEALAHEAKGEPLSEEMSDAVYAAAAGLAAAGLVRTAGPGSEDAVVRQFEEREHSIRLTYENGDIGIAVEWDDGTVTAESRGAA